MPASHCGSVYPRKQRGASGRALGDAGYTEACVRQAQGISGREAPSARKPGKRSAFELRERITGSGGREPQSIDKNKQDRQFKSYGLQPARTA
jgi:hypothetical protein